MSGRETEKIILILVVAVVVVVIVGGLFSMMGGYGWGGMMGGGMMGPGMMGWAGMGYGWWMPLFGVIFLIVLIVGLYLAFSSSGKRGESASTGALDILKERYAKGELTEEQYQRMKKEIE